MAHADDFLSRWSRRKVEARREVDAPTASPDVAGDAASNSPPKDLPPKDLPPKDLPPKDLPPKELSDAEILERLGLPDPDTLGPGDDFTGFMARATPAHLRRRALRKLWGSNPTLACLDGLVDYADDYTDAAMVVENMQTAYQVGRGMQRHLDALTAREAEPAAGPSAAEDAPAVETAEPEAAEPAPAASDDAVAQAEPRAESAPTDPPERPRRPKRPSFTTG